ncbi:transcriptional regulator GcvA [Microbulbifer sp. ANSA003]|uniref:transcriptional regulator GcvA n=1 Tax=Microbulbifer sp. ANSA003 TaxID=3243360 RepID=UPI0040421E4C
MSLIHTKTRSLPSLAGLRGFEAAARHMSFTDAAKELSVTQTAISHQVRNLESRLGVKLFHRAGKSISLTDAGKKLLSEASECFDRLENTLHLIKAESQSPVVTVSVTPSFASKWLIQRLGNFWRAYPDIQLNVHHTLALANFTNDGVDISIRAGDGNWQGSVTRLSLPLDLSPICHPSLLNGKNPLKVPSDLKHQTLLHEDNFDDWASWLKAAGVDDVNPRSGSVMNDSNSLAIAVENCQGVALGRISLIEDDLKSGRIVKPFDVSIDSNFSYYLVCPYEKLDSPGVQAFRNFILSEVNQSVQRKSGER